MEKKLKKVSIVIPVFNGEAYIKETIASICRQTYKELEIIIINDNSSDSSLQIINTAAEADTRILVYNNEIKKGAGGSRDIGIDHLSGDYTIFLDADDI
ncbi:MAG: glycosyltransferase family 2 protein, partial [Oscillospiraceae bacterium]|nr:glycosyltransferase family 2 protein [Oscillospiraceae bacterium]